MLPSRIRTVQNGCSRNAAVKAAEGGQRLRSAPRPPPRPVGEAQERAAAWLRAAVRSMAWGMMMVPFRVAFGAQSSAHERRMAAQGSLSGLPAPIVAAILDSYTVPGCACFLYGCALPADGSTRGITPHFPCVVQQACQSSRMNLPQQPPGFRAPCYVSFLAASPGGVG